MSKVVSTITTDAIANLNGRQARALESAIGAFISQQEKDAATSVRAVRRYVALTSAVPGLSGNGYAALIVAASGGAVSRSTVTRTAPVAAAITAEGWADMDDADVDLVIRDLYRIMCRPASVGGQASGVTAAADIARKETTGPAAVASVARALAAVNAAEMTGATAPAVGRKPRPNGTTDKPAGNAPTSDVDDEKKSDTGNGPTLKSATVGSLIAELTRRVNGKGFTPDAVLAAAFENLAAAFEERAALVNVE